LFVNHPGALAPTSGNRVDPGSWYPNRVIAATWTSARCADLLDGPRELSPSVPAVSTIG